MYLRCLCIVLLLGLVINWPFGKSNAKPDALLGISPGNSMSDVKQKLGDALLVRTLPNGSQLSWNRSPVDDAYLMLGERNGSISSVRVVSAHAGLVAGVTDPFDVALGGSQLGLRTLRGRPQTILNLGSDQIREYPGVGQLRWRYTIRNEEVHAIELTTATQLAALQPMPKTPGSAPTLPPSKMVDIHDGSSLDRSFQLTAQDEDEGRRFERFFIQTLPGCAQTWSIDQQSLVAYRKHHYDKLELSCGDTGQTRLALFDITTFFGKSAPPTEEPI